MLTPRAYAVSFAPSAQTVAVDWFELVAPSSRAICLLGLHVAQTTEAGDAQDEMIGYTITLAAGAFTSGSGGNTGVARPPIHSGAAAASFTAETLNTTQVAAGSGTLTVVHRDAFNVRAGLVQYWTPETAIVAQASEALVIGMTGAPADSISWTATAYVGELI